LVKSRDNLLPFNSQMMRGRRGNPPPQNAFSRNGRPKRHHPEAASSRGSFIDQQEEECVDDLAVAAQYAFAVPASATPVARDPHGMNHNHAALVVVDEDEIDLVEDDESIAQSAPQTVETDDVVVSSWNVNDVPLPETKPNILGPAYDSTDDDDSDEESDLDIVERLAHMEGGGEDEDSDDDDALDRPAVPRKPMTVNEIDAYQADLHQLQDLLQWNTFSIQPTNTSSGPPEWRMAGHIQHHVIEERTIVILSLQGGVLLKEGTPLVLRRNPDHILPLGNILEIFGPVSQPLYSIRLALPREETLKDAEQKSEPAVQVKATELSGIEHPEAENDADVKAPSSRPLIDPWSKNGDNTKVLQANAKLPVFFWHDPAAIMDRDAVYRSSGRGCDASNIFDEEILEVQDYSDDEQERVAKGRRKQGGHVGAHGPKAIARGHDRLHHSYGSVPVGAGQYNRSGPSTGVYAAPQPHGFHSQGQIPVMYPQGVQVAGVPFAVPHPETGYPIYHTTGAVQNSPQTLSSQGIFAQPPSFYRCNGVYQTIPPPPPTPNNAPTSSTQVGPTEAVYYDFS
jgi:hypothetical protein